MRVDDESRLEISALFKYQSLAAPRGTPGNAKRIKGLNEEVFVTQLLVRAEAVDLEFQEKIESILRTHAMCEAHHDANKTTMRCRFADGAVGDVDFYSASIKVCFCFAL